MSTQFLSVAVVLGLALISEINALTQNDVETTKSKTPVVFTTQQDHQNMLDQLGITKLRPGRSSNEDSPNAANYDELKANPYPVLPAILTTRSGAQVSTPEQWWNERRPEIVELLESEVYGRIPAKVPSVNGKFMRFARSRRTVRQLSKRILMESSTPRPVRPSK
jgi:hypothetical protein